MPLKTRYLISALCVFSLTAVANAATPGFVEDFNGGLGGWDGGGSQTVIASGGVGGVGDGYLEVASSSPSNLGTRNTGADYTGDLLADGVTGFSFWLNDVGADEDLEIHVGVGEAFSNFWISLDGFSPPEGSWAQFSVDITDETGWVQTIGSGTFEEALQASDRLLFRHDVAPFIQDPDDIAGDFGIDRITVVPEPVSATALLAGGLLLARRRR